MKLADLIEAGRFRRFATATPATPATVKPQTLPSVATFATVAVATAPNPAANDPEPDPDRWCWPHSTAMNGREINTFKARLSSFIGRGLDVAHAETLADKLVIRDREQDDRHACPECLHLGGYGAASWRCGNWAAAGVAIRARDAQLPDALVNLMQRCDGFVMRG